MIEYFYGVAARIADVDWLMILTLTVFGIAIFAAEAIQRRANP